ncbi:beta-ketoacyl-ACP synthase III [Pseudonocardia spinosispora]|uniref:beta-ketoacyl-ACP synthase III n=1 Tax=Pseudonocardia spinosispora TaxID=103441 RepID=UPI000422F29B|nr:beta-ketoacyl-ACP synthase III [Pseudonocardia spinosispora]
MNRSVLAGIGTSLPTRLVTNVELSARLDTTDEWIRSRTGIRQRYVVPPGTATSELATAAARDAMVAAEVTAVDVVVLATSTPDHPCPATAPDVASRLGLTGAPAFDVAAVCAGFVYALAVADGLISTGVATSALVIGADTFSTILDPTDRTTRAIFGDGAGAVVLRAGAGDEPGALLGFDLGSDGTGHDLITVRAGGSRQRGSGPIVDAADVYFAMLGKPVFMQAVLRMTESSQAVLKRVGWELSEVDRIVAHQANLRILHAVADQLELPRDKMLTNIDRVGNTVAASIPLALADAEARGALRAGDRVVLTGFGGGLAWGSAALRWPDLDRRDPPMISSL